MIIFNRKDIGSVPAGPRCECSFIKLSCIGLFQKISTTPLWTTLNWVLKNFGISKNGSSSFCRIPNLAGSKSWRIPEFCSTLNGCRGIPVKIQKILGKFMDFQSCSPSTFYRIFNVVHEGVRIFSWIARWLLNPCGRYMNWYVISMQPTTTGLICQRQFESGGIVFSNFLLLSL